jgi:hypothetical protein
LDAAGHPPLHAKAAPPDASHIPQGSGRNDAVD